MRDKIYRKRFPFSNLRIDRFVIGKEAPSHIIT